MPLQLRISTLANTVSDIFISYASEDGRESDRSRTALEAEGWSIFWDQTIPAGEDVG